MPVKFTVRGQPISPLKHHLAKEMRSEMTPAEEKLWQHLRRSQLAGFHFRRQQIIQGFIVDFYCHAASLVVEVDGDIHDSQQDEDAEREAALRDAGFRIIRFRNEQVLRDVMEVLGEILKACKRT